MDSRSTVPTVTVLTPRGRSAVAVVSTQGALPIIDGDPRLFHTANGRVLASQTLNRVCFGRWGADPGEDVVVCRVDPETVEICCHGGIAAVSRIVRDLEQRGARASHWQELGRERHSLLSAECLDALAQASTLRTASILLEQSDGLLEQACTRLLSLDRDALSERVDELLRWSDFGRHLTHPWQVVLTGAPNVGKSSLINRLLGYQRSIVYPEPGTTRDVVTAAAVFDGWPVELSDTAGLRDAPGEIEAAGIDRARRQLANADLSIVVLDRSRSIDADERRLMRELPRAAVVGNKADLASAWASDAPTNAIAVSSLTGDGLDQLIAAIVDRLVPSAPNPGTPMPVTQRQIAGLQMTRDSAVAGDVEAARAHVRSLLGPE